ncbi:DUF6442 family protein [Streptococcus sobrinus]|uniref:DUF6442 family protein n=1 Tax=Streptococcus sobrinus TaxID=1310 RepID=UPI00037ADDA0|nr:DUF6442 family protein [Streptococcus sobrinus]AWN62110.1 hypothetical protein DLJ52_07900 [Streptococcus sobrinus]AWN63984.1 hypothetical protein DLJ51_07905 [Streptococcus sobrinus]SQG20926.1 Uncharacterised protein [Streptococcus sobrinus]
MNKKDILKKAQNKTYIDEGERNKIERWTSQTTLFLAYLCLGLGLLQYNRPDIKANLFIICFSTLAFEDWGKFNSARKKLHLFMAIFSTTMAIAIIAYLFFYLR